MLARAGGSNLFGEPMYRFVWGWNRLQLLGGKWTDFDERGRIIRERFEMRCVPKYGQPLFYEDRWYVERWYPPSNYGTPRDWVQMTGERQGFEGIPTFGLYPSRGEYEHFYTVEGPNNEFRQLTWPRVSWLASVVWSSETVRKRTLQEGKDAVKRKEDQQSALDREAIAERLSPWNFQPTVTVL